MFAIATDTRVYHALAATILAVAYSEQRNEFDKALSIINDALVQFSEDPGLLFTKAQMLTTMKRFEEARETFDLLLSLRRESRIAALTDDEIYEWKAFYAMAASYVAQNDIPKALEYLEMAAKNKPDSPFILVAKARALERLERFHDADMSFRKLASLAPETGQVEYINYLLRRKRYSTALVMVEAQLADAAPPIAAKLNAASASAMIAENLGDPAPFLEAALRHAPGCGPALTLYEQLLTERGDTARLERLHREELDAPQVFAEDHLRRSFRMLAIDRNEDALEAAVRGLALEYASPDLRFNHALANLRLGNVQMALTSLRLLQGGVTPTHVLALATESALLEQAGEIDAALEAIGRLLAFEPENVDAILVRARLLVTAGREGEAVATLEPAVSLDPRIALELAGMLLRAGDLAGAGRVATLSLK
jgi:tetratricopeptide (TPR) repeat protein